VHPDHVEAVRDALLNSDKFASESSAGRGNIYKFPLGEGEGIVREYQRGGVIRHILKNGYFLDNRPLRELEVWCHAYDQCVTVPLPLGVVWYKRGPLYYGSIATQYVDSLHLQDYLEGSPELETRSPILAQVGEAIRLMHDGGFIHRDLQVRNILIKLDGSPLLIDFDNAKHNNPVSEQDRHRNLLRLKRSFEKNNLDLQDFAIICKGYGIDQLPKSLSLLYAIKGKASNTITKSDKS
jgi:tRNA A-37 threonylcarbamoyl transferase component Bud32